jgi:hypothetical protein
MKVMKRCENGVQAIKVWEPLVYQYLKTTELTELKLTFEVPFYKQKMV